jgi:hypothetical protein
MRAEPVRERRVQLPPERLRLEIRDAGNGLVAEEPGEVRIG